MLKCSSMWSTVWITSLESIRIIVSWSCLLNVLLQISCARMIVIMGLQKMCNMKILFPSCLILKRPAYGPLVSPRAACARNRTFTLSKDHALKLVNPFFFSFFFWAGRSEFLLMYYFARISHQGNVCNKVHPFACWETATRRSLLAEWCVVETGLERL